MLTHLPFLINNNIFCFKMNIHKTRADEDKSDATEKFSQELKCIVDINISSSSITNVADNASKVNAIKITNPINIFNFRDN